MFCAIFLIFPTTSNTDPLDAEGEGHSRSFKKKDNNNNNKILLNIICKIINIDKWEKSKIIIKFIGLLNNLSLVFHELRIIITELIQQGRLYPGESHQYIVIY